jgi:hypothetical protein
VALSRLALRKSAGHVDTFELALPPFVIGALTPRDQVRFKFIETVQHFGANVE